MLISRDPSRDLKKKSPSSPEEEKEMDTQPVTPKFTEEGDGEHTVREGEAVTRTDLEREGNLTSGCPMLCTFPRVAPARKTRMLLQAHLWAVVEGQNARNRKLRRSV
jgi:hypothetical protein